MTKLNGYGTAAAILGPIGLLFQIIKIFQKKDASEISWIWIAIECVVTILWLIYGIKRKVIPLIISSILFVILNIILIVTKYKFDKQINNNSPSEEEKDD